MNNMKRLLAEPSRLNKVFRGRPFDSWGAMVFCEKKKIVQQILENK